MACQIEKVQAILGKLEKHVDISELKAQVDKKIAEKQAALSFSEAFKKERPSAIKWLSKEEAKYKVATQAISDGVYDSTAGFIKRFYGDKANSGNYSKDDVIYLSTNGNRKGRLAPVINGKLQGAYANIDKAIEAGASFVADTSSHLKNTSTYNVGEVELADYLASKGYTREDKSGYGLWTKKDSTLDSRFKGKFILAHAGIGKSFAVSKNANLIDGDDLFVKAANKIVNKYNKIAKESVSTIDNVAHMKSIFTSWGEYGEDKDRVAEAKSRREEIYEEYANEAKALKEQGKTILSSSARPSTIAIADYVITQNNVDKIANNLTSDLRVNKNSETDKTKIQSKIAKFINVAKDNNIHHLELTDSQYLSDILFSKPSFKTSNLLEWNDKNSTIVTSDGKTKIKVNTLDELAKLSEEYHDLLTSKLGSSDVDFEKHKEYFLGLFKQLETAGIKFKPVTVHFTKTVKNEDLGHAFKNKDEIELSTSKVFENRYPLKVALHEYAHILTMNELDKYPELAKRAKEIMANVLKQYPNLAKKYGFKNHYEFIAEVISSPRFQTQLAAAKSDGKSSIVDKIKKIFNYLLGKVNSNEVNALTDALEVVVGLTVPREPTKSPYYSSMAKELDYTKDQELAKANDTVTKNKPFYKHYIEDGVMGKVYPHEMLNGDMIYIPAGNTGFYYDNSKNRVDINSTGSSMQSKLNDAVVNIYSKNDSVISNTTKQEYQKESSYEISKSEALVLGDTDNMTKVKMAVSVLTAIKDAEANLKKLYPDVNFNYKFDLKDETGRNILGRAIEKIVEVDILNVRPDTIPHEYAHVYINALGLTPAISNILNRIEKVHKLDIDSAKEFLAKRIGENYVNDNVPKSTKELNLIKSIWKFIVDTFNKITNAQIRKELALLKDITIIAEDFKTGKNKEVFASSINSLGVELQTAGLTKKGIDELPAEVETSWLAYYNSSRLSKYGTHEDYKRYLDTIFPDSKVQDILAHDTGYGGSMFSADTKKSAFEESWMYTNTVHIDGKGSNYGLVSGEGFYMYKPNAKKDKWDQYSEFTGYMKVNFNKPMDSSEEFYKSLEGKDYYSKMAKLTNTPVQSNPDGWYMLDNPPDRVTINSIVNEKTGYDSFINQVRPGLFEYVAWKDDQVHILGSKKDIAGFKEFMGNSNSKPELSSNNTLLVNTPDIKIPKVDFGDLVLKPEHHITILGFPQGKEIGKFIAENEIYDNDTRVDVEDKINDMVADADLSYTIKEGEVYKISRDREAWKDWKDQSQGKVTIHEEAIIQLVDAPGVEKLVQDINDMFGLELTIPYPHISIATSKGSLGIGLADKKAFDTIAKEKISYVDNVRGSDDYEGKFGTDSDVQTQAIPSIDLGQTLKAVFYNLENDDRGTTTSDGEESASVPIRSQEFATFTEYLLSTYEKNMNDLGMGNVAIDFYKNEDLNTSGMVNLETKKMSLRYNRMSRTARISEIFLHEVNHLVSADVFANNPRLRRLMNDLRQASLNSGIDYKVFLENVDTPTSEEIEIAKRKFDRVFDNTADPEEFYAYATTNENVYNAIKDIEVKGELIKPLGKVENTMQKILQRLIDVVNQVWSVTTGRSQKGSQQIFNMVNMIDSLAREKAEEARKDAEPSVSNRVKKIFDKIDEKVNPIMDKIEAKSKKLKKIVPSTKMFNKIMDLKMMRDIAGSGAVQYLIREVTRDTTAPEFAELYQIARKTKQVVERATNQIKVGVEEAVNQMFDGETDSTKKAITHVMFDLDLGHLLDTMDKDGVVDMILDPAKRAAEIAKVEAELGTTKYDGQIDGLAEYIVSGNTIMMNQQINANNIVEYKNQYPKVNSKTYKDTRNHIALVDKLVSLKALDKVSTENAKLVQDYLSKDGKSDTLMDSLMMYKNYMDQMKKDAQTSQYNPIKKGYTQAPASPIKYALIPEDQVKAQLSVNMHLESENVYVTIAGKNYYLMTGKIKSVGFNEGALGMISNTLDGVSISSLMRDRFEEIGFGVDQIDEKIEKLVKDISTGKAKGRQFNLGEIKAMIPVHDKAGNIIDYRIQLNKIDRIEMLKEEENVAKVLAHTYARADKLVRTAEQNRNVVDAVIRQSAIGMSENPEDYVVIEEYTKEDKEAGRPYTKLNERWDRIPDYTKEYIKSRLGVNKLPIHKDFVEIITGEKQMTLGNFNYFGLDMKQHPIARARIMALESWVRELLAYVKQTTVVLNGSVVMGNTISNMITAAIHGIDPITYVGEVRKKWILLNEYNELERKLARLNVDRMAGKDVDRKIRQLEDQKVRHPYHSLVEDGQFSPIVEDINTEMELNGQLATMLKNAIDKTKLGHAIHPVLDIAYLDKKTKIYKTMLKVTQYGDAITRQIILEKNVAKREAKLGRKLTKEEYQEELNYVDQLLINYGYTANRVWDWMEKVAGLNFMKYYLRNVKATYKMFKRNRSATIFETGTQYLTGVDFSDSMDTYAKNPLVALTNRFMLDDIPSELSTPHIFGLLPDFSSIVKFH